MTQPDADFDQLLVELNPVDEARLPLPVESPEAQALYLQITGAPYVGRGRQGRPPTYITLPGDRGLHRVPGPRCLGGIRGAFEQPGVRAARRPLLHRPEPYELGSPGQRRRRLLRCPPAPSLVRRPRREGRGALARGLRDRSGYCSCLSFSARSRPLLRARADPPSGRGHEQPHGHHPATADDGTSGGSAARFGKRHHQSDAITMHVGRRSKKRP